MSSAYLEVTDLATHFPVGSTVCRGPKEVVKAVDGVSFSLVKGETYGLVGESGCGKSTTGRSILRLIEPTSGSIRFDNVELVKARAQVMKKMRRQMQIIFQDPYSSLNPRMTVEDIVAEPLIVNRLASGKEARTRARELLHRCGLEPHYARRYAHAFSGGQRQRVVIARAIVTNPGFIVADEPVSALDVSIQSQIMNLLRELQDEYRLSYLFISHDLAVVRHMADRVGVMYLGRIVEEASTEELFFKPRHPYTRALLSAIPKTEPAEKKERIILTGDLPSPSSPPSGCAFHTRCPHVMGMCRSVPPVLLPVERTHRVACHLIDPEIKKSESRENSLGQTK